MYKIVDADIVGEFKLRLTYNDGFTCEVDLCNYSANPAFADPVLFAKFGLLPGGDLQWLPDFTLSAMQLRRLGTNISYQDKSQASHRLSDIITMAVHDAIVENRPEIVQAALQTAMDKYGIATIARISGIKSRTSIYKSLDKKTNVSLSTVVNLAHTVMQLEGKEDIVHHER
ncbi:addiction module antitoxin [Brenneria tiliae]|uniref:Addiction module antitoxin n=1 Tax=Brenneria tiliae TaxID=2914984 RepID=A0ABT0MSW3_9GAMM|nr:addiction module antitoxin [Brenneria tiliae]MCL2892921.1 addiction module antitoxin [Brenneria tiliae]